MKKLLSVIAIAVFSCTAFAQNAAELAKQQKELNEINMKILNAKPTKDAKIEAKRLKKDDWVVPAGEKSIEKQLTESQLLGEELMTDEDNGITKRFIQHTASQVSGTYNTGYAAARTAATTELAALLRTQVAAAMQQKADNQQTSAINAVTVDKFNERAKAIVDATLTNARPVVAIYRVLPNNNYEVQVRLAFDKKELSARLKRAMQQELEQEGDELNDIVDEVLRGSF